MTNPTPEALAELKACPFCGGDELSHGWDAPGIDGSATTGNVQCHSCDALLWRATEAEAITAWNTRPEPRQPARDPLPDAVERLARALAEHDGIQICSDASYRHSSYGLKARAAIAAMPASSGEVGQIEVLFEVWQNDELVASSADESDARHYLAVYGQDGAATLVRAETVRTTLTHRGTDGSAEHD